MNIIVVLLSLALFIIIYLLLFVKKQNHIDMNILLSLMKKEISYQEMEEYVDKHLSHMATCPTCFSHGQMALKLKKLHDN